MTTATSSKPTLEGLVGFYQQIFDSLAMPVNEQGLISMELGGVEYPCMVQDKRLTLPHRHVLKEAQWDKYTAFHPLAENVYRGESPVLKKLRSLINYRLAGVMSVLTTSLVEIAAHTDAHGKLSPRQVELLSIIPEADQKTVDAVGKILDSVGTVNNRLVSIYLKRGGRYKGDEYSRVAITSFPIMEEFEEHKEERKVFGVKLRKKDFEGLERLFEYILPGCKDVETYSYGSNSMTAPYLDVLLNAYLKVATRLNKVVKVFKSRLGKELSEDITIDLSWKETLEDIGKYRDLIPSLSGNDGELCTDGTSEDPEEENAKAKATVPKGRTKTGGVFKNMAAQMEKEASAPPPPPAPPAPAAPQQPPAPAWNAPAPAQHGWGQPPAPAAPAEIEHTERGLSWESVAKRLPGLQGAAPPPGWAGNQTPPPQQGWGTQQPAPGQFAGHPRNAAPGAGWGQQPPQQQGFIRQQPQQQQPQWGYQAQPQQQQWGPQSGPVYPTGV